MLQNRALLGPVGPTIYRWELNGALFCVLNQGPLPLIMALFLSE